MTQNEAQDKMDALDFQLRKRPGRAIVKWASFGGPAPVRLDRVFLIAAGSAFGGGKVVKVPGALVQEGGSFKTLFSSRLVRVKNGARAKKVVTLDSLKDFEEAYPAGMLKSLAVGRSPSNFDIRREGDASLLDEVCALLGPCLDLDAVPEPTQYLSAKGREDYRPRTNGALVAAMRGRPGYDPKGTMEANFNACFDDLFGVDAEGRHLVNFAWAEGPGVLMVDADFDSVFSVPVEALRRPGQFMSLEVDL